MENQEWGSKHQQSGLAATLKVFKLSDSDGAPDGTDKADETLGPTISEKAKQLITQILEQIKELTNSEKYLLNLKLFQASNVVDPLRQPLNPLGSRSEINRTISWIKTHLEEDLETSLPKQQVYEEYSGYCHDNQIKSLSQADFGKVMKQVYPKVRPRRLGTRGNSRYCYSGLRRCIKLKSPKLPDLTDKPLSTEALSTQSSLTAAAWIIVKEWSEVQFEVQFPSLQALARFLVIHHSIGAGTDAANQLTCATESQLKNETQGKAGIKHREMQLQLQKKLQQKNDTKERKRKNQSPKCDSKATNGTKKSKIASRLDSSPPIAAGGESSTSTSTGSTSTSPTQGKPVCDKSLDFTHIPTLPDFKSFQKPPVVINEQQQQQQQQQLQQQQQQQNGLGSSAVANKVAIPRIKIPHQQQQKSPLTSPKRQLKNINLNNNNNAKYKAIQPKPTQQCDNASYNPQITNTNSADIRSQGVLNVGRFKERKCNGDDDCDPTAFPLTRERLDSISNVDKDAMDEYLGTNNSQHEEELSKYFSNNIDSSDQETTTNKLSQLRQLLEQNGISDSKTFSLIDPSNGLGNSVLDPLPLQTIPIATTTTTTYPSHVVRRQPQPQNANNTRRRVSFETPISEEAAVPPSPNTRRKNFSFTPISPGPQSPNGGRQSKCSSTNVSPFVSPRNTPVPRTKNTTHQNAGIGVRKMIKREPDAPMEGGEKVMNGGCFNSVAMSAPASPMLFNSSKSVLENLLHSNSKVAYTPDYSIVKTDELKILDSEENFSDLTYRPQSVPLNPLISLPPPAAEPTATDFNDFDHIAETDTVNGIIDALDDQPCEPQIGGIFNVGISASNQCLPSFNLIIDNNIDNPFSEHTTYTPHTRNLQRSQSIDVNGCYDIKSGNNPSRSVPNTPLSFNNQSKQPPLKNFTNQSSRSYPSTPLLVSGESFNYNVNGDCLLNGQPIHNGRQDNGGITYFIERDGGIEEEFINRSDYGIVDNENGLMDENGILIVEPNFNGN